MRKLTVSCALALLLMGGLITAFKLNHLLYQPLPKIANGTQPFIIQLNKNTSAVSFVYLLKRNQLIQSPRLLLLYIRLHGFSKHLKAGVYEIKAGETARQLLQHVLDGDVFVLPFRITDGTTQHNVTVQLEHLPYLTQQADDWAAIAAGHLSAEGLLLADTYHYEAGSRSAHLLLTAHTNLMQFLDKCWATRNANLPYKTPYEMLIAASIIEKEASKPDEKRLISGIIVNRLLKRMPLQMDPTVIYALGVQYKGKLTHQDLSIDSPYNTYKHYGLPPTPIAMVGRDAIDAAAHPTPTQYLYFVASGDGSHHFSETYVQQREAITEYMHRPGLQ